MPVEVQTDAKMVDFVQDRVRVARNSPLSALVRTVSYGLEGDAIVSGAQARERRSHRVPTTRTAIDASFAD